jgi:hypothetical protein
MLNDQSVARIDDDFEGGRANLLNKEHFEAVEGGGSYFKARHMRN